MTIASLSASQAELTMRHVSPRTSQSQDNDALLTFLRPLLTSLLLHPTPDPSQSQRSPDLLMRQRMLHLPATAPPLYEEDHEHTSSDTARASCEEFVSWMSRPPVELSIANNDVTETASAYMVHRREALVASQMSDDPFDLPGWQAFCCDVWHEQRKVLVGFPRRDEAVRLFMTVVAGENGEVQLDNLFALHEHQEGVTAGLHRWTDKCRQSWARAKMEQDEDEEPAAEYINDADDFWAGYSDEEEEDTSNARGATDGQPPAGRTDGQLGATSTTTTADQEAAIKDIIRGAYTLYRSTLPSTTEVDSTEAFLRLVESVIPSNAV